MRASLAAFWRVDVDALVKILIGLNFVIRFINCNLAAWEIQKFKS